MRFFFYTFMHLGRIFLQEVGWDMGEGPPFYFVIRIYYGLLRSAGLTTEQ